MKTITVRSLMSLIAIQMLTACSSGGSSGSTPLVVANASMKDQGIILASPANGGMVANLYIQPRSLMAAPDTQVVGCNQNGDGALGIASYVSHPDWITQQVLFTDLNVPSRNFLSGFPISESPGVLPVVSYFMMDIQGSFHLSEGDTSGFYQFSVIADDAAEIRITRDSAFDTLIVNNSKPAGANGGCLEQTQAARLGCSTSYLDQSGAQISTVHLIAGQSIPLQVRYWEGPGKGIAFVVLYRKVADPSNLTSMQDSTCGQTLDFSAGSAPLTDLLSRWKAVSFDNLN